MKHFWNYTHVSRGTRYGRNMPVYHYVCIDCGRVKSVPAYTKAQVCKDNAEIATAAIQAYEAEKAATVTTGTEGAVAMDMAAVSFVIHFQHEFDVTSQGYVSNKQDATQGPIRFASEAQAQQAIDSYLSKNLVSSLRFDIQLQLDYTAQAGTPAPVPSDAWRFIIVKEGN